MKKRSVMIINIANDFSIVPSGRFKSKGPHSGESFREDFLVPALKGNEYISVEIDGTAGYQTSFLEEAFGGLVRHRIDSKENILRRITIVSNNPAYSFYKTLILEFIEDAVAE